jgi:hypothetical protein
MNDDTPIRGQDVPPEVKALYDSLRMVFDAKTALDRVDAYGKWLFSSAAIVGALGAGLSNATFSKLRGLGVWTFALAVLALGACLVAASRSIAPQWTEVRLFDLESLRRSVNDQFRKRQNVLTIAAGCFALALALAGLSPLISLATSPHAVPNIHYTIDEKGSLDCGLDGTAMDPGTTMELRIEAPNAKEQPPLSAATVDESGQVKLSIRTSLANIPSGNIDLVVCERRLGDAKCARSYRVAVRH